jgi:hypothetical protein
LNFVKARQDKAWRWMQGRFFVLTEKGVPVKIRAVLRSPYGLTVGSGRPASPARLDLATFLFTGE